jgi:peptidoglycan/LPS O-acetylase OafA/YrhL
VTADAAGANAPAPAGDARARGLGYLPALDGIRAVAIVVIMGYHGGVFLTSGGFYSLDTFFALSGFLITSLLIAEWQRGATVRLRTFWARRARRLLPAMALMVLGVAAYAAFVVPAGTYPTLRGDSFAALFYYANWHYIVAGSNYFNQTGLTSPLTHTWSLAVEEQFYLAWPLVFLGVMKLWGRLRTLLFACVAGALASAAEMALLYSPADVNRLYYGTDTRAQSLLVGAALAAALAMWAERRGAAVPAADGRAGWAPLTSLGRSGAVAAGVVGAVGSALLWTLVSSNDAFAYRGGFLLAALASSAVIVSVVCAPGAPLARLLSLAPLRYVGRISYGLYLWHFPLFIYLDHARTGLTGYPLFAVRVAATGAVAVCSFHLFERPIRQGTLFTGWRAWLLAPASMAAVAVAVVAATTVPAVAVSPTVPRLPVRSDLFEGPTVKVMVAGDSTALTLGIGLTWESSDYDVKVYDDGILGCGVAEGSEYQLQGVDSPMATQCDGGPADTQWPAVWRAEIARQHPNVVMILAGRWEVVNRTYRGRWTDIEHAAYAAYVKRQLELAVKVASSGGARVVLLTAPCYDSGEQPDGQPWPEDSRARLAVYNRLVRQVAASSPDASLINFNAMACPGGRYEEYIDGQQVRESDGVHFSFGGGAVFEPEIWPLVVKQGRRQMLEVHRRR